eukprot:CAMPEP_0181314620 /NCGR_PEP_ID=MMETSP1101-20121128/14920_1 /TAXON_ID=46948 /ORGANISM="Rhodomonas abbreviata, Strain Caron Lab Isolate" /LENGTH=285 /DNA_ID=CAMNT_0023421735 /DNA_START=15 /DNA_END=868 /DNA_ORIENTATION=-
MPGGKREHYGGGGGDRKRNKRQYLPGRGSGQVHASAKHKTHSVERLRNPGIKGVLVSCDVRAEALCASECIMAFTDHAQERYPAIFEHEEESEAGSGGVVDPEKAIAAEAKRAKEDRHFYCVNTGVKGLVFVEFTHETMDPVALCTAIVQNVKETGHTKTKYAVRMTPVVAGSYASIEAICKAVQPVVEQHLGAALEPTSYCLVFKKRSNPDIERTKLIDKVAELVDKKHKVDLTTPKRAVIIDVLANNCLIGVMDDYFTLKKCNLQELAGIGIKEAEKLAGGAG